nr:hypothetical protein [Caulifigura coniformis]
MAARNPYFGLPGKNCLAWNLGPNQNGFRFRTFGMQVDPSIGPFSSLENYNIPWLNVPSEPTEVVGLLHQDLGRLAEAGGRQSCGRCDQHQESMD